MELRDFLILLAVGGVLSLATCLWMGLFKFSQSREDAEDERLWQHLLFLDKP
jgi:hypothetical protein